MKMLRNNLYKNKVLLIQPPFYRLYSDVHQFNRYPLSLGYLTGEIKMHTDWDVLAYNADFCKKSGILGVRYLSGEGFNNYLHNMEDLSYYAWGEIRHVIAEYKPAVLGISSNSQNFMSACIVAKLAKQIDGRIIVIVGGPHPSMAGRDVLNCQDIDIGVKGEGERTIVELLNAIEAGKEFDAIKGICYRKGSQIVENAKREFIENLDSLCFPHEYAPEALKDYLLYSLSSFRNIFTSRGCPYNCFFCGSRKIWSRHVRFRLPENVIKEILSLYKKGLRSVCFNDDAFGIDKQYLKELCDAIIRDFPGLRWECEMHVKMIDEYMLTLMKKAGCVLIKVGIESGNNEMLKKIRKNITIQEALSACKSIKRHGIKVQTFFIIGFPEETEETLNDTAEAIKRIESDRVAYSIFTPYPGTETFEFCKAHGLVKDGYNISLYNHQSPLNHFCINIDAERFRILASNIEKMVDAKNLMNIRKDLIASIFSIDLLWKARELGFANSIRKGMKIIFGK